MLVTVDYQHTQWAVGQGFFHSGRVKSEDTIVEYVYDCGSLKPGALLREMKAYVARNDTKVDVVYLSHFHQDHVIGIPELTKRVPVLRFVIPLVAPAERLLVFAESILESAASGSTESQTWYESLIVNPQAALRPLSDGVVEVIQVAPNDAPVSTNDPAALDGVDPVSWTSEGATGNLRTQLPSGAQRPVLIWAPYLLPTAQTRLPQFIEALARELELTKADLVIQLDEDGFVRRVVQEHQHQLTCAYRAVTSDLNLASLCLYSGPAWSTMGNSSRWRTRGGGVNRPEVAAWDVRVGWLGTGDAPLRKRRTREFSIHYAEILSQVGTFAIPHHGSKRSFHSDLLSIFVDGRPACVAGVGVKNSYGHPHSEALRAVASHGSHFVAVTDCEPPRFTVSSTSRI